MLEWVSKVRCGYIVLVPRSHAVAFQVKKPALEVDKKMALAKRAERKKQTHTLIHSFFQKEPKQDTVCGLFLVIIF